MVRFEFEETKFIMECDLSQEESRFLAYIMDKDLDIKKG